MENFCKKEVKRDGRNCCIRKKITFPLPNCKNTISYYQFYLKVDKLKSHAYKKLDCDSLTYNYLKEVSTKIKEVEFNQLQAKIRETYSYLQKKGEEDKTLELVNFLIQENNFFTLDLRKGLSLDNDSMVLLCDESFYMKAQLDLFFPKGGVL